MKNNNYVLAVCDGGAVYATGLDGIVEFFGDVFEDLVDNTAGSDLDEGDVRCLLEEVGLLGTIQSTLNLFVAFYEYKDDVFITGMLNGLNELLKKWGAMEIVTS